MRSQHFKNQVWSGQEWLAGYSLSAIAAKFTASAAFAIVFLDGSIFALFVLLSSPGVLFMPIFWVVMAIIPLLMGVAGIFWFAPTLRAMQNIFYRIWYDRLYHD